MSSREAQIRGHFGKCVLTPGLEQWYATLDDKPPGYWDDLLEEIETHPLHFGDEDLAL